MFAYCLLSQQLVARIICNPVLGAVIFLSSARHRLIVESRHLSDDSDCIIKALNIWITQYCYYMHISTYMTLLGMYVHDQQEVQYYYSYSFNCTIVLHYFCWLCT